MLEVHFCSKGSEVVIFGSPFKLSLTQVCSFPVRRHLELDNAEKRILFLGLIRTRTVFLKRDLKKLLPMVLS